VMLDGRDCMLDTYVSASHEGGLDAVHVMPKSLCYKQTKCEKKTYELLEWLI